MTREKHAFTLIEILAVLTIIGILAAFLFPSIGSAIDRAQKVKDASNMRQVAMAYINYMHDNSGGRELSQCKNLYEFANILAKRDYLKTAEVYFSDLDPLVSTSRLKKPKLIGKLSNGIWRPSEDFLKFPLSVVVVLNISSSAPSSTTPIIYSRGLDVNAGTWGKEGVYGEEGGFVAFLDGRVKFFSNLTDEESQMLGFYTGDSTKKLSDALNRGARAIGPNGTEWELP